MKRFAILALLVACSAPAAPGSDVESGALTAENLALPFYFAMPRAAIGDVPATGALPYRITTVAPRESAVAAHAGLHVIAVPDR